jgi:superfamily II DNA or RNA helicase/HKD family nuclease
MNDNNHDWVGLFELLDTEGLQHELSKRGLLEFVRWSKHLPAEEIAPAVTAHLARVLATMTLSLRERDRGQWEAAISQFTGAMQAAGSPLASLFQDIPRPPFRQLLEIARPDQQIVGQKDTPRPDAPLAVSALLTGSGRSPSLVSQIQKELLSSDRAEWLVSFIKWSGIRPLRDALRRFTETPTPEGHPRLMVATTSYLGATDLKAIEFLIYLPNTEVRVSYDTHRTRLHAKAYVFHRVTGFGSAYVGSANVSRVALDEGLEWTAKISQHELPYLWRQIIAAFQSHWEDPAEFEPLVADDLSRLKEALDIERGVGKDPAASPTHFFDLKPYAFQQEILEEIDRERRSGLNRHLVIAATGTGKTMVAAFDYHRVAEQRAPASRPSLLFVAHREEILRQSLATFRHVLRDDGFGDLLVGGASPTQSRHLFCSVQSWHARGLSELDPRYFDYVVFDEAHHAQAATYQAMLAHLRPQILLGLTATPERADGRDVREDFGGRFTHEMRLPDAIDRRLLAPFHYFGIPDHRSVDLSGIAWKRGGYAQHELENVFGANEVRAKWVIQQLLDYVTDPDTVRGLGFCVSQQHAVFMARVFSHWGMPSAALTADSPAPQRQSVQRDLVQRRIRFIFTVDLYNEGVDIPEVDTILMLRPTESLTVYLQQLGRGLRLYEGKPHLTVLDFIAPQHRQFRYADRFRALSSQPNTRVDEQIESGFPWLPSGCLIDLHRVARDRILENIRDNLLLRRPRIIQQLAQCRQQLGKRPTLEDMLAWLHFDEADQLLHHGLPSRLLEAAGGTQVAGVEPYEKGLKTGLRQLAISTDTNILDAVSRRLGADPDTSLEFGADDAQARLQLAYSVLWGSQRPGDGAFPTLDDFIRDNSELSLDIREVVSFRRRGIVPASEIFFGDQTGILELHATYTREQILLALGRGSLETPFSHREGVLHVPERRMDVLFVTIDKTEKEFSPTTMYEDYAISDSLFHWQSQSTVGPDSATGQRYIQHEKNGYQPMLFLRPSKRTPEGLTSPFFFCGPLRYDRHEGSHPMSIIWRLVHPLPARILRVSRRAA